MYQVYTARQREEKDEKVLELITNTHKSFENKSLGYKGTSIGSNTQ